ncbi:MAG: hypothetical protein IKK14_06935 [Oscillospiraceae bacterium]|nr:hypothetical protein [Oscillospiraceae bacterium]
MEKLTCKRCCGDLVEMNGTYYCWDCGAKYVRENGELRLLECENCGGELVDCGDHYECDLCGKRYEKAVPKPAPVVSAPAPKVEKPAPKPEQAKKFADRGKFRSDYEKIFVVEKAEEIITLAENLKSSGTEALNGVTKLEDEDSCLDAIFAVCARFFAAIGYLRHKTYELNNIRAYKMKEKTVDEMMKSIDSFRSNMEKFSIIERTKKELEHICARFLVEILKICDESLTKMIAERAARVFTGSTEKDSMEEYCPNILEIISFCEERMDTPQEELTEEYWEGHPEDYDDLVYEKEMLEKEREKLQIEEKTAVHAEEKKVETVKREIKKLEKKWEETWDRSEKLNFFQAKEKKRLKEEMLGIAAQRNSLEEKLKQFEEETEKNIDSIQSEYSKKEVDILNRIFAIEDELEMNHYPGEEPFVELLNSEIKKVGIEY